MKPWRPCSECNSTQFAYIPSAHIEVIAEQVTDRSNTNNPQFAIHMCVRCGHTKLFGLSTVATLGRMKYEIVDVAAPNAGPAR